MIYRPICGDDLVHHLRTTRDIFQQLIPFDVNWGMAVTTFGLFPLSIFWQNHGNKAQSALCCWRQKVVWENTFSAEWFEHVTYNKIKQGII